MSSHASREASSRASRISVSPKVTLPKATPSSSPYTEVLPTMQWAFRVLSAVGGLPMKMSPDESGGIRFRCSTPAALWSAAVSVALFGAPLAGFVVVLSSHKVDMQLVGDFFTANGFTRTDMIATAAFQVLLVVTLLGIVYTLSRLPLYLTLFSDAMVRLAPLDQETSERLAWKAARRVFLMLLAYLPASVGMGMVVREALVGMEEEQMSQGWRLCCCALVSLTYFFLLFPLPPCAAAFLVSFGLSTCTEIVARFNALLVDDDRKSLESVLDCGAAAAELLEAGEPAFGRLAFDECAASLLFAILSTYLCLSALYAVGAAGAALIVWVLVSDAVIGLIYFYRFFYCVAHGQDLEDQVSVAVFRLRRGLLDLRAKDLSQADSLRVEALKDRLADFGSIRPRNAYRLNMSMTLTALGTMVTYLVVLLQFKSADA